MERQPALACLVFAATSLLGLLIVPNLLMVLPYVMLFGHYGIGKYFLEKIRSKLISYLSKLLYFNIGIGLIYFFAYNAFFQGVLSQIPFWLLIIFIQLVFVLFDFVYSKILLWYFHTIRKRIVK